MAAPPLHTPILVPDIHSLADVRQAISQGLSGLQASILNQGVVTEFGGERLTGVGTPRAQSDVVTLGYLQNVLASLNLSLPKSSPTRVQIRIVTQSTFPPDLTQLSASTFLYVSDFAHWLFYDGTVTSFADGGSNYYAVATAAPATVGWHAVDGSTVTYLLANGSLGTRTLANTVAVPGYLKVGSGSDTLISPVVPVITGVTDTSTTGVTASTTTIGDGTGAPEGVATGVSDPGHSHTLTASNISISSDGEPEHFYSRLWFRR